MMTASVSFAGNASMTNPTIPHGTKEQDMSEELKPSEMGADASAWAREFCKRWPSALCQIPGHEGVQDGDDFEATVLWWFANAIETAKDAAWNQRAKPVVRALEWDHAAFYVDGSFGRALVVRQSITALGRYEIAKNDDGTFSFHFNGLASALYGTEDEAKAAAQADFARRVHACLEGYDD